MSKIQSKSQLLRKQLEEAEADEAAAAVKLKPNLGSPDKAAAPRPAKPKVDAPPPAKPKVDAPPPVKHKAVAAVPIKPKEASLELPAVESEEEELVFVEAGEETPPKNKKSKTSAAAFKKEVLDRLTDIEKRQKTFDSRLDQNWAQVTEGLKTIREQVNVFDNKLNVFDNKFKNFDNSSTFYKVQDQELSITDVRGKINTALQKQFTSIVYLNEQLKIAKDNSIKYIDSGIAGEARYVKKEVIYLKDRIDNNDTYSKFAIKGIKETLTQSNIEYDNKFFGIDEKLTKLAPDFNKKRSRESSVAGSIASDTLAGSAARPSKNRAN